VDLTASVDLDAYALDGAAPRRVEHPTSTEEVAAVIAEAHRDRRSVVLWGGGTRISVGEALERYDVAVDLRGLSGVVDHSPADLVCTVRAGTTLSSLAEALARAGQRWPVDAAQPERATVGGTIASAAPSPSRLRFQHPRDWIIGCVAVLGDGTIARAGGRVVKNVTGYDLTRLYSGTFGTLAALTEVSLKLASIDEMVRHFRIPLSALDGLRGLPLDGIVLAGDVYLRVAGLHASVDRLSREVARQSAREIDAAEWDRVAYPSADDPFIARGSVPPWREREIADARAIAYVGVGLVLFTGKRTADELRTLRQRCEGMGGALVVERADMPLKRMVGVFGTPRGSSRITSALKARFDPRGVLAPGRIAL